MLYLATSVPADTITMTDGSVRTGTIVEEQPNAIIFNDPQLGKATIPRSQIVKFEKQAGNGTSKETFLSYARAEKQRGGIAAAIDYYQKAAAGGSTPEIAREIQTYLQEVFDQAVPRISTVPDQARSSFQALYTALQNPTIQAIYAMPGSPKTIQQMAVGVYPKLAEANVALANRMVNNTAMRAQVQALYRDAVALTQNSNMQYLLAHGDAARNNGDLDSAFNSYKIIAEAPTATAEEKTVAQERLNRVAVASNGRLQKTYATPTPAPTPITIQGTPAVYTPAPVVAAPVQPAGPPLPWWKKAWASISSGEILKSLSDPSSFLTEEMMMYAAIIIGALLLLWIIPYQILKFLARRGDSAAGERLYRAKRLGLASLAAYLFDRAMQAKNTRHRCPFCSKGIDNMEDYKDLNFIVCPHCREPITPIYDMKDYINHLITQLKISQKAGAKGQKGDVLIEKDAMLKLVRGVLALAIRRRASDFHLETLNEGGKVRARIDGIMYELITLPREITPAFISAIKVMAQLDITERRVPQDGKIGLWIDQNDYDLRVNTSPASMGEKVVIRILRQDSINISPAKLGLDGQNLEIFERNINKPHGVVIVTGPSGSGKSTSLYVALNQLNAGDKNIVTIEDPIEYQLQGLSQMQVNPAANFTFANGLRSILRQDPDVIMVGEIRDKETAEAALDAAMTGHLVLTTLHTIDAPSAFSRMHDLGIEQVRVANAVNLVIAQRLVRTICPDCRKSYHPKPVDLEKLGLSKEDDLKYVHGTGCDTCMNTGYYGRLAIFEMLELNDSIRTLLENHTATTGLREAAKKHGLRTLREEGIRKISEGVTTVEEVIRVTT